MSHKPKEKSTFPSAAKFRRKPKGEKCLTFLFRRTSVQRMSCLFQNGFHIFRYDFSAQFLIIFDAPSISFSALNLLQTHATDNVHNSFSSAQNASNDSFVLLLAAKTQRAQNTNVHDRTKGIAVGSPPPPPKKNCQPQVNIYFPWRSLLDYIFDINWPDHHFCAGFLESPVHQCLPVGKTSADMLAPTLGGTCTWIPAKTNNHRLWVSSCCFAYDR